LIDAQHPAHTGLDGSECRWCYPFGQPPALFHGLACAQFKLGYRYPCL